MHRTSVFMCMLKAGLHYTLLSLDGWQDTLQNSERLSVVISLSF